MIHFPKEKYRNRNYEKEQQSIKGILSREHGVALKLCWNIKDFLFTAGVDTFIYKFPTRYTIYGFVDYRFYFPRINFILEARGIDKMLEQKVRKKG